MLTTCIESQKNVNENSKIDLSFEFEGNVIYREPYEMMIKVQLT
jgi:hypothetical protein